MSRHRLRLLYPKGTVVTVGTTKDGRVEVLIHSPKKPNTDQANAKEESRTAK